MAQFGEVRYSRAVRGTVWTQFRCSLSAKSALGYPGRVLSAGGVEWQVSYHMLCSVALSVCLFVGIFTAR